MITVWHNGSALLVQDTVAQHLGLRSGQRVSEAQMWEVIFGNHAALTANLELAKVQEDNGSQ